MFAWLALLALPLPAQTIESVLAPGPVIQGHAKNEHDCKSCHSVFDRGAQDSLCNACHKDVGEDIRRRQGLHGKREQKACRSCHTEHKGRNAQLASFDQKSFDHKVTDFALHDKHVGVECAKCHLPGKRWREAALTCVGCHAKDDVHKGGLGRQCDDCHSARSWKETEFDHAKKTKFALDGKHGQAKCDDCHAQGRFKDTPKTCIGCHKKDDEHKGQYGEKCESCHGVKLWKPSTFNHDVDTHYVLKDKHRTVKCATCHTGPVYQKKLGKDCVSCHAKDDKHKETLGRQCADCHTERSWKEPPGFDHDKSRFRLLGAHGKVACKDCHADALYRQTPGRCVDCHRKDDKHRNNLGEGCADCHNEHKWKETQGRFDHDRTKFQLRNAHAARTVRCADCHETLSAFRRTTKDCYSCHRRDDKHEGTLGERCEQCHRDVDWRVARFDHTRTRYPLAGKHVTVGCSACHQSHRFKDAPSDCLSCHRKDDRHKATLGTQCSSCHNVRAWSLWDFDHDRGTRYPLQGKHRKVPCDACHGAPAPAGKPIAAVASDCLACHRKADAHEGRFGRRCEQCHVPDDWRQLRQATTARPAPGAAPPASGGR